MMCVLSLARTASRGSSQPTCLSTLTSDRKALERLDDDEKGVSSIHTPGGQQEMTVVNESGLFNLMLGSRKPEAKRFKRWVTHEVLPSIRKTGSYAVPGSVAALPAPDPGSRHRHPADRRGGGQGAGRQAGHRHGGNAHLHPGKHRSFGGDHASARCRPATILWRRSTRQTR
jgi:hypothetical protein